MNLNYIKIYLLAFFIVAISACKKDDTTQIIDDKSEQKLEHRYVRVLVSDELTNQLSLISPITGTVENFNAKYPKSALYATASGRYATLIHRELDFVENFDSGLEFHGDHVDTKGIPKFASLIGNVKKPTHFKSKGDEIITFNDGDGTLSTAKETDFHTAGAVMKVINAGNVAHHGAMTKFDNGNYAITVKDGSIAGTLPERVKVINASGAQVSASTIQTKGIHGNASDGKVSLFGSASGVLVVEQSGNQRLINYPAAFGTAWFSSILEAESANKFVGFTAALGAYFIDVTTNTIKPILESTDIMQCKVDIEGKNLLILTYSGSLKIFDLTTGSLVKESKVLDATSKDETRKPVLEATARYAYIVMPKLGELHQIKLADMTSITKIKVSANPYQLTVFGFENSTAH